MTFDRYCPFWFFFFFLFTKSQLLPYNSYWVEAVHFLFVRSQQKNLVLWWVLWSVLEKSWPRCRVISTLSLLRWELTSGRAFMSERIFSSALTQLCDYSNLFDVRWVCDDSVTHYIYQGRVGDSSREYRGVKERGLHVVSQYWLHAVGFHLIILQVVGFKYSSFWLTSYPCLSCSVLRNRGMFQSLCIHSTTTQKWAWILVRYPAALRSLQTKRNGERPLY